MANNRFYVNYHLHARLRDLLHLHHRMTAARERTEAWDRTG
jgi:hypothetical protein